MPELTTADWLARIDARDADSSAHRDRLIAAVNSLAAANREHNTGAARRHDALLAALQAQVLAGERAGPLGLLLAYWGARGEKSGDDRS